MPTPQESTPHLTSAFREAFTSWWDLLDHVREQAPLPEFDQRRALQQILMADIAARLPGATTGQWLLFGSLSLPARVPLGWRWTGEPLPPAGIDDAYRVPRTAFDLDLCALQIAAQAPPDPQEAAAHYGQQVRAALVAIAPPHERSGPGNGLGGLVRYSSDLRVLPIGQVMGIIYATPVDPRTGQAIDDPIPVEIDVKPTTKVVFTGDPEPPRRPITAVALPGFTPPPLPLYPSENLFADKACLLTGPPTSLRGTPSGPWHRYKDLFDLYFMAQAIPMAAQTLQGALEGNWNFTRMQRTAVPHPYRLYGDHTMPGDGLAADEPAVDWSAGCDSLRETFPQLRAYPGFAEMSRVVGALIDDAASAAAAPTTSRDDHWRTVCTAIDPRLPQDPEWTRLTRALERLEAAGADVGRLLATTGNDRPLSPDHPARDLRYRLIAADPAAATPRAQPQATGSDPRPTATVANPAPPPTQRPPRPGRKR
ncbi:MAG TPA: nucleotidyl transferase AbiEii/AbiGii toxin family protein [Kineosporiaceae bacterium]|nr:nucleotidyl transferase AbiEii/AbiGii toxin family protein [Kineosporiaceae bacterium]